MGAPISGFANTPFATVMARVARVVGDGSDPDRAPDFLPASGEIVFTPNIKFSKLEVDNKSVVVLNEPVRCTIDPVSGYMIGPDGGLGVRLVASSGVNIEPQGLGYTVTFRGLETRIPDFSIFLEAGEVVDLAKILPVDLQPGIVTTVSSKTVDAVEQALIRLNSLQENVSYTVKSIPDMFRWDGTTLLINGNPGPDLGRITDEKLEDINNTVDSLLQAQSDLVIASIEAQKNFNELDDKLEQAFPDDIFDVGAALGAVEVDVLAQAALDAQGMATAAQQAAITAAQDFAEGKISEAELRAANDAKAKADAARDAAIEAADLDATSKAGQALAGAQAYADAQAQAAVTAAALDAQAKAEAAQEAAIQASAEHADLVAQGASADAIAAAALDAKAKADAAETAAKAYADTQATAAEVASKTHATNEAARVKQEALTEAATDAQAKADAARDAAITAAETYADARKNEAINAAALTAQTKADVAKQDAIAAAAKDAKSKADAAQAAAISAAATDAQTKANKAKTDAISAAATDAQAKADAAEQAAKAVATSAMTTADGKNTTSYKTVTTTPGAAPTNAVEGKNRRQFDMHRNRLSDGTIVGEWMWSGTSWVQVHMGDGILRSLDVGKLTAGTANIETAVVNKLWGQLGVFDKLDVRTDAYVSGINLKNGAVTARTLNVVPEMGQGGLQLKPDGMMVIDAEGNGTVDLRVNADNYLSFYRDDATSFAVSADGELTAQDVSANANLLYRGTELSELLEPFPRGLIYTTFRESGPHRIQIAAYTSRLAYIQAQRPETDRMWRIWATYQAMGNATNQDSWNLWMFAFNGGQHYNQDTWQGISQGRQRVPGISDYDQHQLVAEVRAHSLPWSDDGNGVFSINMSNVKGSSFNVRNIYFWIDDVGSPVGASPSTPWIRPEVTSDAAPTPKEQQRTSTWNMSSFQNYLSGTRVNHASGNLAGGNYSGEWRGIMFFPHATIKSALSGATISKVEAYLQNAHTYAYSGSTILIGTHNYASAPASSPAVAARTSQHFSRGQGRWVTLPNAVGDGFKGGTIKGLAVYGSSTANYATWTPSAPKLRITYKK